jgi:hypothetical protein
MAEEVFYQKRGVRITNESLKLGGIHYPLSSVRSAYIREQPPNRQGPVICIVAGLHFFPGSIAGVVWLMRQKHRYTLCLELENGIVEPLSDKNPDRIAAVQAAISMALNQHLSLRASGVATDRESLRMQLLNAAQQHDGQLSVTEGVIATGKSFETVQTVLEEMRISGFVTLDNDFETGVIVYCFPELLRRKN